MDLLTSMLMRSRLALLKMLLRENFLSFAEMLSILLGMGQGSAGPSIVLLEKYSSYFSSILLSISVSSPYNLFCQSSNRWISIFLQTLARTIFGNYNKEGMWGRVVRSWDFDYFHRQIQRYMRISKYQRKCVGLDRGEVERFVWNQRMVKVYGGIDKANKQLEKEGQSFHDFLEMEQREPNEQGTGRYKFETIQRIQFVVIPKAARKKCLLTKETKNRLSQLLHAYLRLPAAQNTKISLFLRKNSLIDESKNLSYEIKEEKQGLDVYDLLDVFMEYRADKTIFVGIVESNLQEDRDVLDGRACGDGVAVISFDDNLQGLLQTVLHQTLHTLGFDHCLAWKCLMNAWTNFQSWLCPACSRKLYYQLKLDSQEKVQRWIREVILVFERIRCPESAAKGKIILESISQP